MQKHVLALQGPQKRMCAHALVAHRLEICRTCRGKQAMLTLDYASLAFWQWPNMFSSTWSTWRRRQASVWSGLSFREQDSGRKQGLSATGYVSRNIAASHETGWDKSRWAIRVGHNPALNANGLPSLLTNLPFLSREYVHPSEWVAKALPIQW